MPLCSKLRTSLYWIKKEHRTHIFFSPLLPSLLSLFMCVFWTANKPMRWIGADTFPVPLTQPARFAKRNKKVKAKSSSWTSTAKKMYDITVLYTNAMFCMRMILLFLNFALVGTSSSFAFSFLCWTRRKYPSGGYKPHHQEKRDQGNFLVKLKRDKGKKNLKTLQISENWVHWSVPNVKQDDRHHTHLRHELHPPAAYPSLMFFFCFFSWTSFCPACDPDPQCICTSVHLMAT